MFVRALFKSWVWKVAARESRRGLKPLLLALPCVVLGVMSVVAAFSFHDNLQSGVRAQAKTLLGADLALDSRQPFTAPAEALIRSLGGDQSRQIGFAAMAYFPQSGGSRLVQVRALAGHFPYYGTLETEPPSAAGTWTTGANALVDENLMLQLGAGIGERIRIGDHEFVIAGKLRKIPGESVAFSLISPRVYVPLRTLAGSPLLERGSVVRYRVYFRLPSGTDADAVAQRIAPDLERLGLRADTVSRRTEAIAEAMENLSRYLRLAVFIAVLLAGVGVASGVHVYAKQRTPNMALLRCMGAGPAETVVVNLIQVLSVTLVGALAGAALGAAAQYLLPLALKDFLPVTAFTFSPSGILPGLAVGLGTALLFALIPLLPLRKIAPLLALRSSYETLRRARDPLLWIVFVLIAALIAAFALATTANRLHAFYFTAGVVLVFALLAAIARGMTALMRRLAPGVMSFPWRQGLANLHRPTNQTTAVMLAIGSAAFLMTTLYAVQSMLLNQVEERTGKGEPNLVVFDVQKDQRQKLRALFESFHVAVGEEVPVVTMRLSTVNDRPVGQIRATGKIPDWALRREYRSTYRAGLTSTERIVRGAWRGSAAPDSEPVPISLEKSIAETLRVTVGDALGFDVQGVSLRTRVASIREVDWQRLQPNFFVVFPVGFLEQAPQFYAVTARAESSETLAQLQRAIVERLPNVSVVDLTVVLNTLQSILGKIAAAIRFVALFTVATGLALLAGAVLSSRAERVRENILLRTLGAARAQIVTAIVAEYIFLALVSAGAGALLGVAASWGLSWYFLHAAVAVSPAPIVAILLSIIAGTVIVGVLGSWGLLRRPALEALRAEA